MTTDLQTLFEHAERFRLPSGAVIWRDMPADGSPTEDRWVIELRR